MPANPNFGTGYVDWSSYVNANQPNIQADRQKVSNYMGQQYGQLGQQSAGQGFDQQQENLATNKQALSTPGGFEQVLAQANAAYDPKGTAAPPQAPNDPFSAALEGQNAGALFSGDPNAVQPKAAASPAHPYSPPKKTGADGMPAGPEGPMPVGPQHRQDNLPDWGDYVDPKNKKVP